jgi:hypothetical protein
VILDFRHRTEPHKALLRYSDRIGCDEAMKPETWKRNNWTTVSAILE